MSKQQPHRKPSATQIHASPAPHELFFKRVEDVTRKRFAEGDTAEQPPTIFLYRTDADEPLRYDVPDDGEETRNIISSLLGWDRCLGVGYLTEITFESFPDSRDAQRPPSEIPPKPRRTRAIVGVFHAPHELPRMIRLEVEGRGTGQRIGRVRTDFTPTPSAVITAAEFASHEANVDDVAIDEASSDLEQHDGPDIPQLIRGFGPTIVVLPSRRAGAAKS